MIAKLISHLSAFLLGILAGAGLTIWYLKRKMQSLFMSQAQQMGDMMSGLNQEEGEGEIIGEQEDLKTE